MKDSVLIAPYDTGLYTMVCGSIQAIDMSCDLASDRSGTSFQGMKPHQHLENGELTRFERDFRLTLVDVGAAVMPSDPRSAPAHPPPSAKCLDASALELQRMAQGLASGRLAFLFPSCPCRGTLDYLDHLILPNLAVAWQCSREPWHEAGHNKSAKRTTADSVRDLFSRSAMSDVDYEAR